MSSSFFFSSPFSHYGSAKRRWNYKSVGAVYLYHLDSWAQVFPYQPTYVELRADLPTIQPKSKAGFGLPLPPSLPPSIPTPSTLLPPKNSQLRKVRGTFSEESSSSTAMLCCTTVGGGGGRHKSWQTFLFFPIFREKSWKKGGPNSTLFYCSTAIRLYHSKRRRRGKKLSFKDVKLLGKKRRERERRERNFKNIFQESGGWNKNLLLLQQQ